MSNPTEQLCPCGKPLHYRTDALRDHMIAFVKQHGDLVKIIVPAGTYLVPRHYIALHGMKAQALPTLATQYGWKKVDEEQKTEPKPEGGA